MLHTYSADVACQPNLRRLGGPESASRATLRWKLAEHWMWTNQLLASAMARLVAPLQLAALPSLSLPRCLGQRDQNSWMLRPASVCLWKPIRSVMGSGNGGVPRPVHLRVERDSVPQCGMDGLGGFITSRHRTL